MSNGSSGTIYYFTIVQLHESFFEPDNLNLSIEAPSEAVSRHRAELEILGKALGHRVDQIKAVGETAKPERAGNDGLQRCAAGEQGQRPDL